MSKIPRQVEFVCNVPRGAAMTFAEVGTGVVPRVIVDTDDRFSKLGKQNFIGPPHGYYASDLVGIYTRLRKDEL